MNEETSIPNYPFHIYSKTNTPPKLIFIKQATKNQFHFFARVLRLTIQLTGIVKYYVSSISAQGICNNTSTIPSLTRLNAGHITIPLPLYKIRLCLKKRYPTTVIRIFMIYQHKITMNIATMNRTNRHLRSKHIKLTKGIQN